MPKKLGYSLLFSAAVFTASLQGDNALRGKYFTADDTKSMLTHPVEGLSNADLDRFILGKSFFSVPWVQAPSATTARDGLGPLFSANTCTSCHPNNAVSFVYNENGTINRGYVSKLSVPKESIKDYEKILAKKGFLPEPTYGEQISINSTTNVAYEAKPKIEYETVSVRYPAGDETLLRKPKQGIAKQLTSLQYGPLHPDTNIANRMPQALVGLGLIEMLSDAQILANEDRNDSDDDGISGKANRVFSPMTQQYELGRYTWKASRAFVKDQVASAAHNDMSLTSPLFASENCTQEQNECLKAPKGDSKRAGSGFDLPPKRLDAITFYLQNLKVPHAKITQKRGQKLFETVGCAKCHVSEFTLENGLSIAPYSDFLLHDMGKGLSDGRSEFDALPSEFRTQPLWGIGQYSRAVGQELNLLHDGRARTIEEAILWHGGEAKQVKKRFMRLSTKQRDELIEFIKEL